MNLKHCGISLLISFLATTFPWDKINNDTLEYSQVKCYSGIFYVMAELSNRHKINNNTLEYFRIYEHNGERNKQGELKLKGQNKNSVQLTGAQIHCSLMGGEAH